MMKLISAIRRRLMVPRETLVGYEHPELVDLIFQKTLNYVPANGEKLDVRGAVAVLDFGGGCGLHYKRAGSPQGRWAIVETPAMIARAAELQTDRLRFFSDISAAAEWLGSIDLMHSDGAVQYTTKPSETVEELCGLRARDLLWRRLFLSNSDRPSEVQSSYLGDNGPGTVSIKEKWVQYNRTAIAEAEFLTIHKHYQLAERGSDWFRFTTPGRSSAVGDTQN